MRLTLDECIDCRLAEVKTVPQMGWVGIKDGQLLTLTAPKFDVFVTVDRNLSFQQDLSQFDIAVIILQAPSNRLADLKPLVPKILAILGEVIKGQATVVTG